MRNGLALDFLEVRLGVVDIVVDLFLDRFQGQNAASLRRGAQRHQLWPPRRDDQSPREAYLVDRLAPIVVHVVFLAAGSWAALWVCGASGVKIGGTDGAL